MNCRVQLLSQQNLLRVASCMVLSIYLAISPINELNQNQNILELAEELWKAMPSGHCALFRYLGVFKKHHPSSSTGSSKSDH